MSRLRASAAGTSPGQRRALKVNWHNFSIRRPARLHLHAGLPVRVPVRLFKYFGAGFISVDGRAFQQPVVYQIRQRLQVLAALDDPASEELAWNIDTISTQHRLETMHLQAIKMLDGQQHRKHA